MHSDNTISGQREFRTPSCHLCLQHETARPQSILNGSCLRVESGVSQRTVTLPFPKDLALADYRPERTGSCATSSPRQVYAEEIRHPSYSWGDVRPGRWDWPLDSPHAPCTCVREIRRECGCVQRWYYPERPFNGRHAPPNPKIRGQRYYREVLYVSEQHYKGHDQGDEDLREPQWDNRASTYNGHCQKRRVSFKSHEERHGIDSLETSRQSSPNKPRYNGTNSGPTAFFPTEVPPSKLGHSRVRGSKHGLELKTSTEGESPENHGNQRKSQGTVREQIKQVVTELEEVLGGLKKVQLEMKEVVQQIDILTSNIDLSGEEPSLSNGYLHDARHRSSNYTNSVSSGVQEESPKDQSDTTPETSDSSIAHYQLDVDIVHINDPAAMRNHTNLSPPDQRSITAQNNSRTVVQQSSELHGMRSTANGTCLPHRTNKVKTNRHQHHKGELENHRPPFSLVSKNHRPPPYPQNGQVKTQTTPCPGKHKTISSTIV
ncbi:uncharacterized protein [Paramisgurnus dabryanus]|uniref:uncharacterized protein n=1 Tax=Paramisgurnus dabryanus TaxID=90735 RepID=UPI0031F3EFE9